MNGLRNISGRKPHDTAAFSLQDGETRIALSVLIDTCRLQAYARKHLPVRGSRACPLAERQVQRCHGSLLNGADGEISHSQRSGGNARFSGPPSQKAAWPLTANPRHCTWLNERWLLGSGRSLFMSGECGGPNQCAPTSDHRCHIHWPRGRLGRMLVARLLTRAYNTYNHRVVR